MILRENVSQTGATLFANTYRYFKTSKTSFGLLLEQYKEVRKKWLIANESSPQDHNGIIREFKSKMETLESDIFKSIWIQDDLSIADLTDVLNDTSLDLSFKELIISAILLSCVEFYNDDLLKLLFDVYVQSSFVELQIKSIIALIILSTKYTYRINLSRSLSDRLNLI